MNEYSSGNIIQEHVDLMPCYNLYLQILVNRLFDISHYAHGLIFYLGHDQDYVGKLWYVHADIANDFDFTTDGFTFRLKSPQLSTQEKVCIFYKDILKIDTYCTESNQLSTIYSRVKR